MLNEIVVQGARTHNLQNITVTIPRNQLVIITGPSGSGKSSLAFDTLYAEGQRRYVESLSAYARQFLSVMEKPDVDHITGLSPAIAIEQKATSHNPRSTVGTITEIYDYLRLLFARAGIAKCPVHNINLDIASVQQMLAEILQYPTDTKLMLLAPVVRERKGSYEKLFEQLLKQGFLRARIDNNIVELSAAKPLAPHKKHTIEVIVDRFKANIENKSRIADSLETALRLADNIALLHNLDEPDQAEKILSAKFACPYCNFTIAALEPRLFSFNNPQGACECCDGLGVLISYPDPESYKVEYSICADCQGARLNLTARQVFIQDLNLPALCALTTDDLHQFCTNLTLTGKRGAIAAKIMQEIITRLKFLLDVGLDYLTLDRSAETLSGGEAQRIRLASQVGAGLVGVMYVLDEPTIGLHPRDNALLINTLYKLRDLGNSVIVVEHDREVMLAADYLIDIGPKAGKHGGQVVIAAPLQQALQYHDSITVQYLTKQKNINAAGQTLISDPLKLLTIHNATGHNLQNITVAFPVGLLIGITGVSGSGKSTLINDTLLPALQYCLDHKTTRIPTNLKNPIHCTNITGVEFFDNILDIDQSPIGRTPRSNPATYTGIFTHIRELFAATIDARARGYDLGRFSFNVAGGRCEVCAGDGVIKVEMHFLADLYVTCDSCNGARYKRETLEIKYKGKNIAEILNMSVEEAYQFFHNIPKLKRKLAMLLDVGLDYVKLGQNATTLSGGEAQRLKVSRELSKRDTGKTLYILDEPTTGLHFQDIELLIAVLFKLRDQGNTIVIIEHNLDVLKTCDWIIDLGPEGGQKGGRIVATGTVSQLCQHPTSFTGQYLRQHLA